MKILVRVVPNSSREEICAVNENEYKVYLNKPPINNKANLELKKIMKKYFKSEVRIIKGLKSKDKILEIQD